eukprot:TRINITY_DN756_c0_g1_i1.p2 TRINITY_DN756_c0_g1~~TRINITY_DN756_c0_g1_i1.p2  ORF type:complete len:615 (+),score=44.54 TRINITY_DN756_c0_g1_i1:3440-5284(+)
MKTLAITGQDLTIEDVVKVARGNLKVTLQESTKAQIKLGKETIDDLLRTGKAFYGINTGFGVLERKRIDLSEINQLAENIIISHAVAVGEDMPIEWVRAGMVIRINSLSKGNSGVQLVTVETMIEMLNKGIIPVIPRKGSLAASGDLCLLSHMALTFCQTQEDVPVYVYVQTGGTIDKDKCKKVLAKDALKEYGISPIKLGPKEGLCLTNGSSITAGIACLVAHDAAKLFDLGIGALALSCEALCAKQAAFDDRIHDARNQKGQHYVAECLRKLIKGSKMETFNPAVQDSYSLRCAPQVQGVLYESINYANGLLTKEINGATDNPLIFPPGVVLSGGNFHGEIIGHAMDTLKMTVAELGAISERRMYKMLSSTTSNNLPDMLTPNPGLNSGYMIIQYTSAALALENLKLSHSDTVFSLPTSGGAEDYNSNGANATLSAVAINANVAQILANEILCSIRGIELRNKESSNLGEWTNNAYNEIRKLLGENTKDHYIKSEIETVTNYVWNEPKFIERLNKEFELATIKESSTATQCYIFSDEDSFEIASALCANLWIHRIPAKCVVAKRCEVILKAKRKDIPVIIQVKGEEVKIEVLNEKLSLERREKIIRIIKSNP